MQKKKIYIIDKATKFINKMKLISATLLLLVLLSPCLQPTGLLNLLSYCYVDSIYNNAASKDVKIRYNMNY